ncbi:GNAT family N-acetyltransferase [Aspergillus stella-maris]|uniref:GNAT family N-acetyltransferase n=1 Tax=Aspergillus stella-maris TaxID=1810926 RepID=UPI003CCE3ECD
MALPDPFLLLTERQILVPTPIAVHLPAYRALYASLHADPSFCHMGFGEHFPARQWSDDETRHVIVTRDIDRSWKKRGLGDFAVGLREVEGSYALETKCFEETTSPEKTLVLRSGDDYQRLVGKNYEGLQQIQWVGYAGVREPSLPPRESGDPSLPSWDEMVEVRYGIAPKFWGRALACDAAQGVLSWTSTKKGVKKFIAETEKANERSGRLLRKLGFVPTGMNLYWKDPGETEWECSVSSNSPFNILE